jgi:hypothetical protein
MKTNQQKIQKLEERFETVTLQLEKLEISKEMYIELEVNTSKNYDNKINSIQNKIYDLEDKQFYFQSQIEDLEKCS